MRPLSFRPLRAAVISAGLAGCGAPESVLPPVVVDVPAQPPSPAEMPSHAESPRTAPSEALIPTRMTIISSGDSMLAYVSVPSDGSWKDLEGANSAFYYETSSGWIPVPGCQSVFDCDVSSVRIGNTRFKAVFKNGLYATAEATFP